MRRIGLFGGTFDPPHRAHVALARSAIAALQLDELRWVPAGLPWQKTAHGGAVSAGAQREAMVRLAIAGEPGFVLERCELERPGPSYTLDTVIALQAAQPQAEWVLVIGSDQYAGLHSWRDWRDLLSRVVLAVGNRPGPQATPDAEVLAFAHRVVPLPMLDISSTDIRQRVTAGLPIADLVPPGVARYIEDHSLYQEGTSR
jgi:nicotinate-nucleotide adenylyltransferase